MGYGRIGAEIASGLAVLTAPSGADPLFSPVTFGGWFVLGVA